jgi:hypothetical protein
MNISGSGKTIIYCSNGCYSAKEDICPFLYFKNILLFEVNPCERTRYCKCKL